MCLEGFFVFFFPLFFGVELNYSFVFPVSLLAFSESEEPPMGHLLPLILYCFVLKFWELGAA